MKTSNMLIPYNPQAARAHPNGFAEHLRRGGRANPIPLGGRANPIPLGGAPRDEELAGVVAKQEESESLKRRQTFSELIHKREE